MPINPIELQKALKGLDYPASKDAILELADQNGVDEDIRSALDGIPDKQYEDPTEINGAVGSGD
jgi:hypothetical protein